MHSLIFKPSSPLIPGNEGYTFNLLNSKQQYYGMGWFVTDNIALHGGSWNGARAMLVKDLERVLTIAIFLNFDSSEIRNELTESTYELIEKYLKTTANNVHNSLLILAYLRKLLRQFATLVSIRFLLANFRA